MIDLQQSGAGLAGYALLAAQAEALFADERDFIANAAQFSAFLFHELGDLNWAGFYLNRNEELVLGPFQGKVACVRIPFSKGVCGAAARTRLTQRVDDVHAFPGHIACDSASSSELVVPLLRTAAWSLCSIWTARAWDASAPRTRPGSKAWWRYSCA